MPKVALITNISGQDGSYLAELLLKKGYTVHGIGGNVVPLNTGNMGSNFHDKSSDLHIYAHADISTGTARDLLAIIRPDEVYNLGGAGQLSENSDSADDLFSTGEFSALKVLDAIRILGLEKKTRYYHASPSALCGLVNGIAINEMVSMNIYPSWYATSISDFRTIVNYRETFGLYACSGILFNHESPRRSENFVTRKITRSLANITQGLEKCLHLGNLNALRDWGHARDYVKMQWLMLQQDNPEDFVVATGVQYSVRQFVTFAALELGIKLRFVGKGVEEKGIITAIISPVAAALKVGDVIVAVDPCYIRPAEASEVSANPAKARRKLGWAPETSLQDMVIEMVQADLACAKKAARLKLYG